jgi:hypothetical protein
MRKECKGTYNYKGFTIRFHDHFVGWSAEPNFLMDEYRDLVKDFDSKYANEVVDIVNKVINFINDYQFRVSPQSSIARMKKEIDRAIKEDDIINELKKNLEERLNEQEK